MRHSVAEPCPLWSIGASAINVLPLKTQIKDRGTSSPPLQYSLKFEITFCVRGVLSPLLANIYLHYVFDLWVDAWRKKYARGDVVVVRYADDNVLGFQYQADADRFLEDFRERLRKFGLELHPDKTRRIEFGRFAEQNRKRRGEGKPETFDFLGFTHISGKDRNGSFAVKRTTIGKRMRAKLLKIKQQLRRAHARSGARKPDGGSSRSCRATSTTTRYRATLDSSGVFRYRVTRLWRQAF